MQTCKGCRVSMTCWNLGAGAGGAAEDVLMNVPGSNADSLHVIKNSLS